MMKAALLVLASILFGLVLCECGLRLFSRYGSVSSLGALDKPLDTRDVVRYVAQLAAAPGTDRKWFAEDPPPLPNRSSVSEQRLRSNEDFQRRRIFASQADYIWNRNFVESNVCSPVSLFKNYPSKVLVFDPPSSDTHPFYRFPPNVTMVGGLVTNEFGMRGPPVTLAKPPKTVRIAFVGASTTIGFHQFPYSYPERVVHWLNRFAESKRYDVRFEVLNAGREGINSEDIASIVRDELLPLDPDLIIYYEGANQFPTVTEMVSPHVSPREEIEPQDPIVRHKVPELIRANLKIGDLLDRALNRMNSVSEPPKPAYRLTWPAGVDEANPDVDNPNLPLQLPIIVKDLDSIRNSLKSIGGQLVLSSFAWLAKDGMALSPGRHQYIYQQLNTKLWPLRYADIHRMVDFQNRVYRRYAATRGIPYLDDVALMPPDPDLYEDAVHMTQTGERLRAWIVFQELAPIIRDRIESGQLPRARGTNLPPPPSLAAFEMPVRCEEAPSGPVVRIAGGLSLDEIQLAYSEASIERARPVKVTTAAQRWAYAASLPIHMPIGRNGPFFLFVRARVVKGQIGLGLLDGKAGTFQLEKAVAPSPGMIDTYLRILVPERASALMIRNTGEDGVRSEILIEDATLVAPSKPQPE